MRFAATHKLVSYLMTLAALATLAGSIPASALAVAAAAIAASFVWEPPRIRLERWSRAWNVVAVLGFAATLLDMFRTGALLEDGVYFLLFLLVTKLFNRRASRDYQQAYVLTFLILVAATVLSADLWFLFGFAAYVLFATWGLILFNLRRDMEENYLFKHSGDHQSERVEIQRILNSRRVVGPSFLVGTALASLGILAGAILLFVVLPRVGFGLFALRGPRGVSMAGFSAEVRLDQSGLLRPDPTVVFRVAFPHGTRGVEVGQLHFRGVAFDTYRDGAWSHQAGIFDLVLEPDRATGVWAVRPFAERAGSNDEDPFPGSLLQEVQLEPMDSATVFGASRLLGIRPDDPGGALPVRAGPLGDVEIVHGSTIRYRAYSDVGAPPAGELRAEPPPNTPAVSRYLRLPRDLPGAIRELGRRLTADAPTEYDKVLAVERYLSTGFRYTLDIRPTPGVKDPLEDFLFHRKSGHCEFFATAMAILLRAGGVPTRNVDGFLGGEWNSYGGYLAVRESDAHSWVEVFFPRRGWVTFDPTPAGPPLVATSGWLASLRELADSLTYAYYRFVLEYDLQKQFRLFHAVASALRQGSSAVPSGAGVRRILKRHWRGSLTLLGVAALLGACARQERRRRLREWLARLRGTAHRRDAAARSRPASIPIRRLFLRTSRRLARHGYWRPASQTPQEFARSLTERKIAGAADFETLVALYYQARFGGMDVPDAALRDLAKRVRHAGVPARPGTRPEA